MRAAPFVCVKILKFVDSRMNLIEVAESFVLLLGSGFFVAVGGFALYCLDHDVAGSVLQTCEFNHCHVIAAGFQFQAAEPVGQVLCETILENSVFEHRLVDIAFNLAEKLVLASWHAEN